MSLKRRSEPVNLYVACAPHRPGRYWNRETGAFFETPPAGAVLAGIVLFDDQDRPCAIAGEEELTPTEIAAFRALLTPAPDRPCA